jgi:hypothetical protein|tara:strand:+ start:294 stop:863 length:570 start_codon:yes stop_codon:yes gene_type:complete
VSSRIEKDFAFDSCIHFDNNFLINSYNIEISFLIETSDIIEQNTAIDRVGFFIYNCVNHSLFVNENEVEAIQKYKDSGIRVIATPDDPFDQILSMLLLLKLNSISEGRLKITDLTLGSTFSDGVRFCMVSEIAEDIIDTSDSTLWWNQSSICTDSNCDDSNNSDNIVKLFGDEGWIEAGLSWQSKKLKK